MFKMKVWHFQRELSFLHEGRGIPRLQPHVHARTCKHWSQTHGSCGKNPACKWRSDCGQFRIISCMTTSKAQSWGTERMRCLFLVWSSFSLAESVCRVTLKLSLHGEKNILTSWSKSWFFNLWPVASPTQKNVKIYYMLILHNSLPLNRTSAFVRSQSV